MTEPTVKCLDFLISLLTVLKGEDVIAEAENKPVYYSCNNEFDSNVTVFEMLSNAQLIVVASHLSEVRQKALVAILYALYSGNYWRFNAEEEDGDCMIYTDDDLTDKDITALQAYNVKAWYDYLFNNTNEITYNDISYETKKPGFAEEYYSEKMWADECKKRVVAAGKPHDANKPGRRPVQKIYTIDAILKMAHDARKKLN